MTPRDREPAPHLAGSEAGEERVAALTLEEADTPVLREYRSVKETYPDAIVLARLGDFFELFGPDAETAAPVLGVTLTSRSYGQAGRLPMCGVPHHAVSQYVRRLLDAGHRVVLWDQVGEVVAGRTVRREVTRVLSPGTVVEGDLLEPDRVARCVALAPRGGRTGVAALDASSGELLLLEVEGTFESAALRDELARLDVAELLVAEGVEPPQSLAPGVTRTAVPGAYLEPSRASERLRRVAGTVTLRGLGVEEMEMAVSAAGAVLGYCERSRISLPEGFLRVTTAGGGDTMPLDPPTRRNLELLAPLGGGGPSLLQLLDRCRTPMGSRLLRRRIQEPLTDPVAINARLDGVAALVAGRGERDELRKRLAAVRDLERLVGRCVQGLASPRDLGGVRDTCLAIPALRQALHDPRGEVLGALERCDVPADIAARLAQLLVDEPPATARDGGAIRPGADPELDSLQQSSRAAREYISTLEERERGRTGIRSLKVGYNRVFGYYLEIPNAHRDSVPADYVRKQTLVGAERYITPDLKEQETIVLHARERMVAREQELLRDCARTVADRSAPLLDCSAAVAVIDVAQALATVADEEGWTRPDVDMSSVLDIEGGRHPLVERSLGAGRFVANDTSLDVAHRVVVLTGPNMAGKSTYLRQVALIALLAQVGAYVPAARARIGVCDRIFTRVGAQDDLSGGLSTFMVEMAETAAILRQATGRSLVVLDEIGRGTSTYDGLSIAQAIVEHIHESPQLNCRTLFATHYHELTELAGRLQRVVNARVEVLEDGERITFLHRIVPGGADRSYGIHVARLAGLPAGVIARARQLLAEHESERPLDRGEPGRAPSQLDLAIPVPLAHPVVDELLDLDVDALTPLAALNKLAELRQRVAP